MRRGPKLAVMGVPVVAVAVQGIAGLVVPSGLTPRAQASAIKAVSAAAARTAVRGVPTPKGSPAPDATFRGRRLC